jgi:hypothetical protein
MEAMELLGRHETAVLDAVYGGGLRSRVRPDHVRALADDPASHVLLDDALRHCERAGLLRSSRDTLGRRYALTAAGRARLRAQHRFERALLGWGGYQVYAPSLPELQMQGESREHATERAREGCRSMSSGGMRMAGL